MARIFKPFFMLAMLVFATISVTFAQEVQFSLVSSSANEVVLTAQFPDYETSTVNVNGQTMQKLHVKNAYPIQKVGFPELMSSATSVIIPEGSRPTVEIISSDYELVENFNLAPSKGKLYRNVDPSTVPYTKGEAYNENRFLYEDTVAMGEPYLLRDYYGVSVKLFPFAYNPVQKTLKVYKNVTVKVHFNSSKSVKQPAKVARTFDNIYSDHFLNYNAVKSTPVVEEGEILILSPEEFCTAMQPYAEWKSKTGYKTTIVSLDTVGTTSSAVKSYITNYYNSHNLAFVVLVGDNTKFPVIRVSGNTSDNYYGEVAGSDNYPDIIIGKISAETVAQVNTQVERSIQYEQNPTETAHFPVFLGIASSEGPGDNNEYDYQHVRNIGTLLSNYTYTSGYEVFEGSQGGMDQPGATASQVSTALNNGVGVINYCGHGSETYWVTTGFDVSDVNNLNNAGKLPFIISTACVNGDYYGRTCFAEAWVRATKNGQPTGAVGTLMSTINQPWNPPMCAQDNMAEYLTGRNGKTQQYTFGGIAFNGIIKMLDEYSDYEVSRTWILFGDPALAVRTAVPEALALQYTDVAPIGTPTVTFTSTVENAKVVASKHGEIIATGRIADGAVTLDISALPPMLDTLDIVAWHHNYIPFQGQLLIIPNDGPYVICTGMESNIAPESGEFVTYDVDLFNVGNEDGSQVRTLISTEDPYISLYSNASDISVLHAGDTVTVTDAFFAQVHSDVPAFHTATINLDIIIGDDTNSLKYPITLRAPQLVIQNLRIDDSTLGNNNGKFDFGESADVVITVSNTGNAAAKEGRVKLYCFDEHFLIDSVRIPTTVTGVGATQEIRFRASIDPSVTEATLFVVHADYKVGHYNDNKMYNVKVGSLDESWESGNFSTFNWDTTGTNPWIIVNEGAYEGNYAARSASIGNSSRSILSITHSSNAPDSISFYYKVSSEENYDFLNFYIDNQLKDQWSGVVNWSKASYFVTAGQHTYKWEYRKDTYYAENQDKAWIDMIQFPTVNGPTSVEESETTDIRVFPNPATDMIRISLDETLLSQSPVYELFDLSGRLLQQDRLTDASQTVNLSNFVPGLYILKVSDNNQTLKTFKIVKK